MKRAITYKIWRPITTKKWRTSYSLLSMAGNKKLCSAELAAGTLTGKCWHIKLWKCCFTECTWSLTAWQKFGTREGYLAQLYQNYGRLNPRWALFVITWKIWWLFSPRVWQQSIGKIIFTISKSSKPFQSPRHDFHYLIMEIMQTCKSLLYFMHGRTI